MLAYLLGAGGTAEVLDPEAFEEVDSWADLGEDFLGSGGTGEPLDELEGEGSGADLLWLLESVAGEALEADGVGTVGRASNVDVILCTSAIDIFILLSFSLKISRFQR